MLLVPRVSAIVAMASLASLCSCSSHAQSSASSTIFLGELRSITLTRPDTPRMADPDAESLIVVSNSCGEETATLRVVRSTAPLPPIQILHFTLGEWCELPIVFERSHWLVVPSSDDGEALALPILYSGEAAFAFVRDERLASAAQLALQRLPEAVEYPYDIDLGSEAGRQFVRGQSSLEVRDGRVWVVQGVLLSALFPDLTAADLP